ncbi:MAG: DNA polymerase III, subunit gamma and tau, partial [Armatimonadota bacterium]
GRIAHAYLFTGPRGSGKTSAARILAKCLCCENGITPTPCLECRFCKEIASGSLPDVTEMDAASESGVDQVRAHIVAQSNYAPMEARYRIFIIDEVHDLSQKGFDALLKTIEEPPPHVVFILATTELHKVPITIRSRCQKYEFRRGTLRQIEGHLRFVCEQEGIEFDEEALRAIARMSDGGYRDALTLLEQVHLTVSGKLTRDAVLTQLGLVSEEALDELLRCIAAGEPQPVLEQVAALIQQGKEPKAVVESLALRLNELTRALYIPAEAGATEEEVALAKELGADRILRYQAELVHSVRDVRDVTLPRVWVELALLRLARPPEPIADVNVPTPPASTARNKTDAVAAVAPAQVATSPALAPNASSRPRAPSALAAQWEEATRRLIEKYPKMKQTLQGSAVRSASEKRIVVGLATRFVYDRLQRSSQLPRIMETVNETVCEVIGEDGWRVEFTPGNNGGGSEPKPSGKVQSEVVEGNELANAVVDVMGAIPEDS